MQDCKEIDILSVTTTVPSMEAGQRLAREIVGQRLGACVQVDAGILSVYRWQGVLQEEPELRLTIKTIAGHLEALQALFARHHPYEVPQFLCVAMRAGAAYAQWVQAETSPLPGP